MTPVVRSSVQSCRLCYLCDHRIDTKVMELVEYSQADNTAEWKLADVRQNRSGRFVGCLLLLAVSKVALHSPADSSANVRVSCGAWCRQRCQQAIQKAIRAEMEGALGCSAEGQFAS